MSMPVQRMHPLRWTEEEFYAARDAAPQGERWELVDGEVLVTPSPHWMHQRIVQRLNVALYEYVRVHAIGEVFVSPLDVKLQKGLVLQPDILVVPKGVLRSHEDIVDRLLLAVETISPSSARYDRVKKRPAYQRNRVRITGSWTSGRAPLSGGDSTTSARSSCRSGSSGRPRAQRAPSCSTWSRSSRMSPFPTATLRSRWADHGPAYLLVLEAPRRRCRGLLQKCPRKGEHG